MLSLFQVRQLIELGFAPLACDSSVQPGHLLTVKVYEPDSGRVDLIVTGIALHRLANREAVQALIDELRDELSGNTFAGQQRQADTGLT
ncbi:DUF1652 domain-containing protein [Pseudomonas abieticivorans]|uniref:DUF1652 domain-containing protein n=1 Tax=Pseudomonas abieticivorans TaxID=2931382 RepID=UPI0020BFD677|nr:DUF1652 domain-containing protein [Pseudomonas sp. PIA16]